MATTIKDIARTAGVSHSTVSRALSGHPRISRETQRRVLAAAHQLKYIPDRVGQSLKRGRTGTIGVVHPSYDPAWFFPHFMRGLDEITREHDQQVLVAYTGDDFERERRALRSMLQGRVDGLIITPTRCEAEAPYPNRDLLEAFIERGRPVVYLDKYLNEPRAHVVATDNVEAGYRITRKLLDRGHQRIAFWGSLVMPSSIGDRCRGYQQALRDAGIEPEAQLMLIARGEERRQEEIGAFVHSVVRGQVCTAVVVHDESLAEDICRCVGNDETGQQFEVGAICFGPPADGLPIISLRQQVLEMGRAAARLVHEGEPTEPQWVLLEASDPEGLS